MLIYFLIRMNMLFLKWLIILVLIYHLLYGCLIRININIRHLLLLLHLFAL